MKPTFSTVMAGLRSRANELEEQAHARAEDLETRLRELQERYRQVCEVRVPSDMRISCRCTVLITTCRAGFLWACRRATRSRQSGTDCATTPRTAAA